MYHLATSVNSEQLHEFIRKYQHQEKFMTFCKDCHNYNALWSCPPLQFDANQFLQNYNYIYIVGVKVIHNPETVTLANTPEKVKEITMRTLREVKDKLANALHFLEGQIPDSVSLASGGCHICQHCSRLDNRPCIHPEKMRYSLDSFGFDLTAITSDLLQIELKWSKDTLPEYYTLIHGLLTKDFQGDIFEGFQI